MEEMHETQGAADLYAPENKADNEALARALSPRLRIAVKRLKDRIEEGELYERYLDGRGISGPDMEDDESMYHFTDFPLHYQLKSALVPMLVSRWPKWMISQLHATQKPGTDQEFEGFRRIAEALLDRIWTDQDLQQKLRYATEETIPMGISAFVLGWDPVERVPSAEWISARNLLIDPDGGPMANSWRWVAEWREYPVEELRKAYPDFDWDTSEQVPRNALGMPEPDSDVVERGMEGPAEDQTMVQRLFTVYLRGDMPPVPGKTKRGGKGKNEVVILTDEEEPRVVARYEWPWIFDRGDWPVEVLRFTFHPTEAHPPSMLRPGHSLQEQASWNLTFFNTAMRLTVIRKVLVNTTYIADEEMEALESPTDLEFIQVDDPAAFTAIHVVSFMDQFPHALQNNLTTMAEIYREVMGVNEIVRESKSHTTAVDVSLQEQRAQQRLGVYIAQVERFVTNVARKLIQIAMYMMNADDLFKLLGDVVEVTVTQEGMVSPYWAEDGYTAEEVRRERSIRVEPDSLRHVSKDQRVQEMGMMMDRVTAALQLMKDGLGLPLNPNKVAEIQINFLKRLASEAGIQNVDELFPRTPDELFLSNALPPTGTLPPDAAAGGLSLQGGAAPGGPVPAAPPPAGVDLTGPVPGPGGPGGEMPALPPQVAQALGIQ